MATSREEALESKGRYGKVDIGAHFIYGQVVDVHSGGDYVQFLRGEKFQPRWFHRRQLQLHPVDEPAPKLN